MLTVRQRKAAQLARWLGPWANDERAPGEVVRRTERLHPGAIEGAETVRAYRYEKLREQSTGTFIVAPGLHYAGPDDPRLDRFCRVLASAGHVVWALFIRDFLRLEVTPRATRDVAVGCEHIARTCADRGMPRPALFSISFGSAPAIEVAASERHRDQIGGLVLFGGFHDFNSIIRFSLTKRAFDGTIPIEVPHDPLNNPAVFINLLPLLEVRNDPQRLGRAWLEMTRRTWGRPELRPARRRAAIAEALAAGLPPSQRELFLIGCGLLPGGGALLEASLAKANGQFAFTDPRPHLPRVTAPVVIAHGRDDDVIPYTEAAKLRAGLRSSHPHQMHLTGLYGHTGSAAGDPSLLAAELETMHALLLALVDAPHELLGTGHGPKRVMARPRG